MHAMTNSKISQINTRFKLMYCMNITLFLSSSLHQHTNIESLQLLANDGPEQRLKRIKPLDLVM